MCVYRDLVGVWWWVMAVVMVAVVLQSHHHQTTSPLPPIVVGMVAVVHQHQVAIAMCIHTSIYS